MALISIYIANLGKYNEGELVGEWIDLPYTEDELNKLYVRIKLGSFNVDCEYTHGCYENGNYYEEMAIHDFETEIDSLKIGEYDSIGELNSLAESLENFNADEQIVFTAIMENDSNTSYDDAIQKIKDGDWMIHRNCDDMGDVAREYVEEMDLRNVPDIIKNNINYNSIGEEFDTTGTYVSVGNDYVELY
jgi:antirestriction protein